MSTRHWMQSSRSDDSQDVGSSKNSQDGSQMLDTRKIEEIVEKHKTTVSAPLHHYPVVLLMGFAVGQNPP